MKRLQDHVGTVLRALRARLKNARRPSAGATPAVDVAPSVLPPDVLRNLPRVKPRNEFGLRRAHSDDRESV